MRDSAATINAKQRWRSSAVRHCRVVSRIFRTFNLAERHPALGHAVMAPLICWSFSNSMFRYLFVDHVVVLGEAHLRRMLQSYARYYNEIRTHRSLNDDAPLTRPVQRSGHIVSHAMVGGLHHQYVRI